MTDYTLLTQQLHAFCEAEPYFVPLLSNASALLRRRCPTSTGRASIFCTRAPCCWGRFRAKPACIRIPLKGVCGTAAAGAPSCALRMHAFPGHIACDNASNSEIVLPIVQNGAVMGVLDIDSPQKARFTAEEEAGLRALPKNSRHTAALPDSIQRRTSCRRSSH